MNSYPNQGSRPLETTRGHLMDHVGLSVTDLDAWVAKLKREGVTFLEQPYKLGDTHAAMIEGPSHEAIELVFTMKLPIMANIRRREAATSTVCRQHVKVDLPIAQPEII